MVSDYIPAVLCGNTVVMAAGNYTVSVAADGCWTNGATAGNHMKALQSVSMYSSVAVSLVYG